MEIIQGKKTISHTRTSSKQQHNCGSGRSMTLKKGNYFGFFLLHTYIQRQIIYFILKNSWKFVGGVCVEEWE